MTSERLQQITPPPKIRIDRGEIIQIDGDRGGLEFRTNPKWTHWPLTYYRDHNHITPQQARAGNRFYVLFQMSGHHHHHVQFRYAELSGDSGTDRFDAKLMMGEEYKDALLAINGVLPRLYARKVCCDGEKAGRANMDYLRCALDDLAAYFERLKRQTAK